MLPKNTVLPQTEPLMAITILEEYAAELTRLLSQQIATPEDQLELLRKVPDNALAFIEALKEQQVEALNYVNAFLYNTVLCIGAHYARSTDDIPKLALINLRLFELATGKISLAA